MKRLTLACLSTLLLSATGFAADHRDSPLATNDPTADINDIYAFVNPRNPAETIAVITVVPFATALSAFSDAVDYKLHIDNGSGTEQVLTCRFPGATRVTCSGIGSLAVNTSVGATATGAGGLRIYTGLRDDPFFFDGPAFNATRNALAPRFTNPGVNSFNGNTLAIVLGIPNAAINGGGSRSVLKVYSSTTRSGGDGIGAGISGSWYDRANPGHGINLEVVRSASGENRLYAVWNTYDRGGRQLYLFGEGPINGSASTVPVSFSFGGSFPPPGNPAGVRVQSVGTLTFNFSNCNNGSVTYALTDGNLPASGTVTLNRLTAISGQTCEFLSRGQIDRMGRPGINTALINLVPASGTALKDAYNRAVGLANWTQFQGEIAANLAALDTLDGAANALLPPATLAGVLVDDRLIIDVSKPACDEYLAVELGVAGKCGGRTLARDVIDDTFGAVVGPGVSDNVANDSVFLTDFPFLGEPR